MKILPFKNTNEPQVNHALVGSDARILKKIKRTILTVLSLMVLHVLAMMGFESLSLWQSVWLTLTTITTVGYGDLSAKSMAGQASTIILIFMAAITLVTFLVRDYVDYRIARNERIRSGLWDWNMDNHILIINAPKYNADQFFQRLVTQIREDDDYQHVDILLLNTEFSGGLSAQLKDLGVRHVLGNGNNNEDLARAEATRAKHIFVLARDEYHADSDSISFDIVHRLSELGLAHITLVECVVDANRKRMFELDIKSILRPIRSYPEILVRAMDAPGSEVVIEDMFTRKDDHPERYSIWLEGESWADVVAAMLRAGVGTPMAFINKDGDITVHPRGDVRVYAQSLIILVKSDQVPTQEDVTNAFQKEFQKFAVEPDPRLSSVQSPPASDQ
ncbi:MAG: two pore domain potassium channel family protein [Bermanella sp.]